MKRENIGSNLWLAGRVCARVFNLKPTYGWTRALFLSNVLFFDRRSNILSLGGLRPIVSNPTVGWTLIMKSWRRLVEDHRRRRGNVLPTEGWTICMRTDINSGIACLSLGRFFFFESSIRLVWFLSFFFQPSRAR